MQTNDRETKYPVLLLYDVDPGWMPDEKEGAERETRRLGHAIRRQGHSVTMLKIEEPALDGVLSGYAPQDVLVFNWCESLPGVRHSEPLVAETLERLRFTYTGACADTLRLSYDKARVKEILAASGVATPPWRVILTPEDDEWERFPAIVKPAFEHCSLGVDSGSVVMTRDELRARVAYILSEFDQPALVEVFVDGREFHVPIWGNESAEMLPPVEMDFAACADIRTRLCSYDAKFVPDSVAYRTIGTIAPARLTEEEQRGLTEAALAAYHSIGCRDYGRVDIRMGDDGIFYVLDINPNADISADASLALAAERAGYCYGALGSRVLEFAAERLAQNLAPHQ